MQRPAGHVDRVVNHRRVPLHEIAREPPEQASKEDNRRNAAVMEVQGLCQPLDRERRIGFHHSITPLVGLPRRFQEMFRAVKFGHDRIGFRGV